MRTTEEMLSKNKQKAARPPVPDEPDDMELMLEYPEFIALDKMKSVFDRDAEKLRGGINTSESVFDRQAKFRPRIDVE